MRHAVAFVCITILASTLSLAEDAPTRLHQLKHRNPGLVVDLGVGLWAQPLPMDYDQDGDLDLVVATADKPYNGVYFFENPGDAGKMPVFKPAVRLGDAEHNITVSYDEAVPHVLTQGKAHPNFLTHAIAAGVDIPCAKPELEGRTRAKQWKVVDFDGDGARDVVIGIGYWDEYGWDDAYNEKGEWTNGPLRGWVYVARNRGTTDAPQYDAPVRLNTTAGTPVDVYGAPSPNFCDFDGDGDLDLMCGSFLDTITYFENTGTRTAPAYAPGRELTHQGEVIKMDLEMLQVIAVDWDSDADVDLIVGQEDGRVAFMEHTGKVTQGQPAFLPPRFFQQEADAVKVGALCTPYGYDWDADGDDDLIVGDTAGYLSFVENLDGGDPPRWAKPVYLKTDGEAIRIQAGPNGSIQGPCEAKWGYTVVNVADWNHDGLPDLIINSIWGKVLWYENMGSLGKPKLKAAQAIEVAWDGPTPKPDWFWWDPEGKALVTQWRTTPNVLDFTGNGLNDLVMLDIEGYLSLYERRKTANGLELLPPKRVFQDENGEPLRLKERRAGGSGRRKFIMADWDGDGLLDILLNSKNTDFMKCVSAENGVYRFKNLGLVDPHLLAGHTTCPSVVDWDRNGVVDLVIGAEDGFFYYLKNPAS
jgi:hypothetical protein